MPPHIGDDLHDRLGGGADRRRRDPEQPRPLIGGVDPAARVETKRHPRSEFAWHRQKPLDGKSVVDLDLLCRGRLLGSADRRIGEAGKHHKQAQDAWHGGDPEGWR